MPKQKDLKRIVRSRMQKTGESYTTARLHLVKKTEAGAPPPAADPKAPTPSAKVPNYAALAGVTDDAVKKATGCNWERWVWALDRIDAQDMPHRQIAEYVHEKYRISGWWAQSVTVGYERIRGLREIGQRRSGSYEANKSKTFAVPLKKLYAAFSSARTRARWLPGAKLIVKTANAQKSMRIRWEDSSAVDVHFTARGEGKSQVAIQHRLLPSKSEAARLKTFWTERLAALAEIVTHR